MNYCGKVISEVHKGTEDSRQMRCSSHSNNKEREREREEMKRGRSG